MAIKAPPAPRCTGTLRDCSPASCIGESLVEHLLDRPDEPLRRSTRVSHLSSQGPVARR